jgi:AAA family ATPase
MAKALANECSRNFIAVKGPELISKFVGDSEKAVRDVFRKARAASPSIVFFDEIDSLAVTRGSGGGGGGGAERAVERVLSQLLIELDGIVGLQDVTVLAATNRPDLIDGALLRPGRIDRILYVGPPDEAACAAILRIALRNVAHSEDDVDVAHCAAEAFRRGFSGAECVAVCREAALIAMEENVEALELRQTHLAQAIARTKPHISKQMLQFYKDFSSRTI